MSVAIVLTPFKRRKTQPLALTLLCFSLLGGCALDPYIDVPVPETVADAPPVRQETDQDKDKETSVAEVDYTDFLALQGARERTAKLLDEVKEHREEHATASAVLNILTFGAAAAGGVAAVYGAAPNLVLGLGLTAAGAFTANSVFVGKERIALFLSGIRALHCTINTADRVAVTNRTIKDFIKTANYDADVLTLETLLGKDWTSDEDKALFKAAHEALANYKAALLNRDLFQQQDQSFASVVDQATLVLIDTLNKRLAEVQLTPEEIFKRASGISVAAVGFVKQVTPPPTTPKPAVRVNGERDTPSEEDRAKVRKLTDRLQTAADVINGRLETATNELSAVSKTCLLDEPPPPPLKVVGAASREIVKEQMSDPIEFTGGSGSLNAEWKDPKPKTIEIKVIGRSVVLLAKAGTTAGPYALLVTDGSPGTVGLEVKVTVKQ
jgi:hypothetical protein